MLNLIEWIEQKLVIFDDPLPNKTDAFVGFACNIADNKLKPSPQLSAIVKLGVEFFKRGIVDYIIFTGGNPTKRSVRKEADLMKDMAVNSDVPPNKVFSEIYSRSTFENASFVLPLLLLSSRAVVIVGAQQLYARRVRITCHKLWTPYGIAVHIVKAWSPYGGGAQKRLKSYWRFMLWNTLAFSYHKLRGWA